MNRLAALAALALLAPRAAADLDPGSNTPYQLRVILDFADQRPLTPAFQDKVARELADQLALTFGALARVEVTRAHPLLKDVRERGLQRALDGWGEISSVTTHFILVDHVSGRYRVQTRRHDGVLGLASPVVREESTPDRGLVAVTAARLIERDFALVGTVTGTGVKATLHLRGGKLGAPLGRWVKEGDVFAVARVVGEGAKQRPALLEWALLVVERAPQDGACECGYYRRFQGDGLTAGPGVLGYRAVQVPAITGAVRLRLVDEKGMPLQGLKVEVRAADRDEAAWQKTTASDGLVVTPTPFDRVAFVRVHDAGKLRARFPVPIVDDRLLVVRLNPAAATGDDDQLLAQRDRWVRRAAEGVGLAGHLVTELNAALRRPANEESLALARRAAKALHAELVAVSAERDRIRAAAGKTALDLSAGEAQLGLIRDQGEQVQQLAERLEGLLKEANSAEAKAVRARAAQARFLEGQADYEGAIRLYAEVLAARPEEAEVAARLKQLRAAWDTDDKTHLAAREFVYATWPKVDVAGVRARVEEAAKAFAVLKAHGDRLTPRKLLRVNVEHANALQKRLEALRWASDTEDSRAETKALARAVEALTRLHNDVTAYLTAGKKGD